MIPYVDNSEANTYFTERYNSGEWDAASEENKTKLLKTATRLMDNLNYAGDKTVSTQEREFPRGGDTVVPQQIKDACCEIAFALLIGRDVEYDHENQLQDTASLQIGRIVSDAKQVDIARAHSIPSIVAWNLLRPFLRNGSEITLSRVD